MLDIKPRETKITQRTEPKKEETPPVIAQSQVIVEQSKVEERAIVTDEEKEQIRTTNLKKGRQKRVRRIVTLFFGLSIFFFITTVYFGYETYRLTKAGAVNMKVKQGIPTTPVEIINAVSRHMMLPDSSPQIATVQDAKKLSTSQTFFKNAENGDVVIVFDTMIIVYRPALDIIVAVGDITGNQLSGTSSEPINGTATPK